jgi:vacuolar-type H+-ATPase subunit E/Vma4
MSLSSILAGMEAEAAAEIDSIGAQSVAVCGEIRAAAEHQALQIRERYRRAALAEVRQERARCLNRSRLELAHQEGQALERLFAEAMQRTRRRLAGFRSDPSYRIVLAALISEAVSNIEGDLIVRADPRDEAIVRVLLPDALIEFDLDTWGGIEARTSDGRITVLNTLEARLEQAEHRLRQEVMPLFRTDDSLWANTTTATLASGR